MHASGETRTAERAETPPEQTTVPHPPDLGLPVPRHRSSIGALVLIVILFSLGATVGMSSIAGFGAVFNRLARFDAPWLAAAAGGVVVAFLGYRVAFDGVVLRPDTSELSLSQRLGVVAAGFGAFVYRGGTAIDRYVMRMTGHDRRESDVRLAALQVLEMVPVALGATIAAYIALVLGGRGRPPLDFSLPWAIGPVVLAPVVLWGVHRYRDRWSDAEGWRYWAGVVLAGIFMVERCLVGEPARRRAFLGMAVFAAAEMFAVWAAMASFGYRMSAAGVILGYGVGYVISRRSAPLGGAGLIDVMLIVALLQAGAPLTAAIVGTFTYRFFNLWCTMPASMAALITVRRFVGAHRIHPSS